MEAIQARARQSVYWPKIDDTIKAHCQSCETCQQRAPSQPKQPLIPTPPPEYPCQHVVADLFEIEKHIYLSFACRLTGWLEIGSMKNSARSIDIIKVLREWFHRLGIPEEISLDGGPNLDSKELLQFLKQWGVRRRLSSAYYPQSNGRAEAAVKTSKRIIMENVGDDDKIARALLAYRNTPLKGSDTSPAQLMLGRNIREFVPAPPSGYRVSNRWSHFLRQREKSMIKTNENLIKQTENRLSLGELPIGCEVRCQNTRTNEWDRMGMVVENCGFRQYKIRMHGSGRIVLRSHIH